MNLVVGVEVEGHTCQFRRRGGGVGSDNSV
jgi:hypothetical protein